MIKSKENFSAINILNAEPLGYNSEAGMILAELGKVVEKEMSRTQLVDELGEYDVLIVRLANQIDREIIDAGRRLRVIVTATTGLDHIDVAYARQRGISVLSLHIPLTDETFNLIGSTELALLPRGAALVNTSRGRIIDEQALIEALERKHLAGAALDVVCGERSNENHVASRLLDYARRHDNVLITPHIGGATHESMAKTEIFMAHKLTKFLRSLGEKSAASQPTAGYPKR